MANIEIQGAVVFSIAISPHPLEKITGVVQMRTGPSVYAPALVARSTARGEEYRSHFPVLIYEVNTAEELDNLRKALHQKIDATCDMYIEQWRSAYAAKAKETQKVSQPGHRTADSGGEKAAASKEENTASQDQSGSSGERVQTPRSPAILN